MDSLGVAGAALATALSELASGATYMAMLFKKRLLSLKQLIQPPSLKSLLPLLVGGATMLLRQLALNVAFVSATRMTQAMDATGVAAAAYAITNQVYSLGVVVMLAIQSTGATLVPAALAEGAKADAAAKAAGGSSAGGGGGDGGVARARQVADRLIGWSVAIAAGLALAQLVFMPFLTPLFTPLEAVQAAVVHPARGNLVARTPTTSLCEL